MLVGQLRGGTAVSLELAQRLELFLNIGLSILLLGLDRLAGRFESVVEAVDVTADSIVSVGQAVFVIRIQNYARQRGTDGEGQQNGGNTEH